MSRFCNCREADNTVSTGTFRKPTFTALYLRWDSFVPLQYKRNLVSCLIYRAYRICSNQSIFKHEITFIENMLLNNGYPKNFICSRVKLFYQHINSQQSEIKYGPEQMKVFVRLPFVGEHSYIMKRQLCRLISLVAPQCRLNVIFSTQSLNFLNKSKVFPRPITHNSRVVYKINCKHCSDFYVGITVRLLSQRIKEHKSIENSALYQHMIDTGHSIDYSNPEILERDNYKIRLLIKESLFIHSLSAPLNKALSSYNIQLW